MFLDLVKQARSHRGFRQDRKVTRQELEHLVECARFTPAARNDQVLKYYLAEKPETVAAIQPLTKWAGALAELHLPRKGAEPVAYIVICLDGSLAENPTPYQRDVGIVAQTMLLAAVEMGLNGCMIGSFAAGELREKLGLPEAIKPQLLLALGEGTDRIVMTDVGEDGSTTYYRDAEDTHYVPKRTLEQLILNP
ncbi:MAG: nitroreductase family protein [Clostridiales bacterium]|nr:nitroreductase family protein [Clostridiales bacterium]MDD7260200.1 nitroreductase family protein [Eubacteriales bacterium]MDY6067962.1 nitroreductase family protein [Candidatus Faecousia sp.]